MPADQNRGQPPPKRISPITLWRNRNNVLGLFKEIVKQQEDVFIFHAGWGKKRFLLRHPNAVKDVLVTQADNFTKGPAFLWLRSVIGNSLLVSEGEYHRSQYQLMVSFFNRASLDSYHQIIVAETQKLMEGWTEGMALDVSQEMHRLSLRILAKTLFNVELGSQCDEILNAAQEIGRQPKYLSRKLFPLNPLVNALPLPENIRLKRAIRALDQIVLGWITERKAEGLAGDDLLTSLIRSAGQDPAPAAMTRIRDEVIGFLIVGHETTATAMCWSFYCLSAHPSVRQAFHHELDSVLANTDSPDRKDVESLTYTRAFFAEVLRLYPPSYAVTRFAENQCQIGATTIPKGATVTLSSFITHRDERFFSRPQDFTPDRWAPDKSEPSHRSAYFPFGAGARQCIGANFAKLEAILILATIGKKWQWSHESSGPIEFDAGLSLSPKFNMKMKLVLRSSDRSN